MHCIEYRRSGCSRSRSYLEGYLTTIGAGYFYDSPAALGEQRIRGWNTIIVPGASSSRQPIRQPIWHRPICMDWSVSKDVRKLLSCNAAGADQQILRAACTGTLLATTANSADDATQFCPVSLHRINNSSWQASGAATSTSTCLSASLITRPRTSAMGALAVSRSACCAPDGQLYGHRSCRRVVMPCWRLPS